MRWIELSLGWMWFDWAGPLSLIELDWVGSGLELVLGSIDRYHRNASASVTSTLPYGSLPLRLHPSPSLLTPSASLSLCPSLTLFLSLTMSASILHPSIHAFPRKSPCVETAT